MTLNHHTTSLTSVFYVQREGFGLQWFSNMSMLQNNQESLAETRLLGLSPRISNSAGLEENSETDISNKFSDDSNAAHLGPHFENHLIK